MRERTTQVLLAAIGVLLLSNHFRAAPGPQGARAEEAEEVPALLRARSFELVDERGQVRASLQVEQNGEAVFRLRDAKGAIRVKIGASEDGSGLLLLDDRTEPAVHALAKASRTTLTLAEKGKENRVLEP